MAESEISYTLDPKDQTGVPDPEERLKNLAKYIDDLFAEFENSAARKKVLDAAKEGRKKYAQELEKIDQPWPKSCGLTGPLTAIAVDSLEPKMWGSLVGQDEIVRAEGEDEDSVIIGYDNYWLVNEVKIRRRTGEATHDLALDGTVYPFADWRREETLQRDFKREVDPRTGQKTDEFAYKIDPETGMQTGEIETEDFVVPTYEGGYLSHMTVGEVYLPDDVDDEDWETTPAIYIANYSYGKLQRKAATEIGWMNITEDLKAEMAQRDDKELTPAQKTSDAKFSKLDKLIPCLVFQGEFDLDGTGEPMRLVVTKPKGKDFVVRVVNQLDLSFKNTKLMRRMTIGREKGTSWGRGVPFAVAGLQNAFDTVIRRIVNAVEIQIDPFMLANFQSAGFKDQTQTITPGGKCDCQNPKEVQFVQFPGDATRFLSLVEVYLSFLERTISTPDFTSASKDSMGVKQSMGTATGTMALLSEGNVKHDYKGRRLQEQYLDVLETMHNLYYKNMPLQVKVEMLGLEINKMQMAMTPKFALVAASSSSNKFIDRQETTQMVGTFKEAGLEGYINGMKVVDDLLESYGKKDKDSYKDPAMAAVMGAMANDPALKQELVGLIQQRQQAMQMQQAAQTQGGGQQGPPEQVAA